MGHHEEGDLFAMPVMRLRTPGRAEGNQVTGREEHPIRSGRPGTANDSHPGPPSGPNRLRHCALAPFPARAGDEAAGPEVKRYGVDGLPSADQG